MEWTELPIFRGLTAVELEQMQAAYTLRQGEFHKGEVIFRAGDVVRETGVVLRGSVNVESIDLWGNRSILSNVAQGQVFAETYALCGEPMMVDAVAADSCRVLFLPLAALTEQRNETQPWYPKLLRNLLALSMQKNLTLTQRIFCTTAKTVRSRLLTYLSVQAIRNGSTTFRIPFDRQQLADYLNLDRTALSKELGRMRDDGILEFYKSSFRLKTLPEGALLDAPSRLPALDAPKSAGRQRHAPRPAPKDGGL